jgi:predicted amidophosphoribosyltransferase
VWPAERDLRRKGYNPAALRSTDADADSLRRRKRTLIELARAAARFLLPSVCLACGSEPVDEFFRGGVCRGCWEAIPSPPEGACDRCAEALPGAPAPSTCGRCLLDPPPFDALRAAAPYLGSAREILLAFKFRGADSLGAHLAEVMERRLAFPRCEEVASVPATRRSRRVRGYHPADVLAEAVARRLGLPYARRRLVKVRETEVQSRVPLGRRSANVWRAFRVAGAPAPTVLLVDDVATSGATARECARLLKRAGAREVWIGCFARASRVDVATAAP